MLDDGQAKPAALALAHSVGAVETLEKTRQVLGANTGAVVSDDQLELAAPRPAY